MGKTLAPIKQSARLLTSLPGVSDLTAHVMVAEIGVDMARFATASHLISWAGLCPRNDESGKRRSTRVRKSGTWLKTTLVTAAWAAVRVKNSYLQAQFLRLKARRGAKKAILAVAASMLTAAYHMLKDGVDIAIWVPITSRAAIDLKPSNASCADSMTWDAMSNSLLNPHN